jgi:hypothetical protein
LPARFARRRARAHARTRAFDRARADPSCEWRPRFIWRGRRTVVHRIGATMTAAMSWFVTVLATLALVLVLNTMGLDVMATVGSALHGAIHFLSQPLITV